MCSNLTDLAANLTLFCDVAENPLLTETNIFGSGKTFVIKPGVFRDPITVKKSCCPLDRFLCKKKGVVQEAEDEKRFGNSLRNTEQFFLQHLQVIKGHTEQFEAYLTSCFRQDRQVLHCPANVRLSLQTWYKSTKRFYACLNRFDGDKLRRTINAYLTKREEWVEPDTEENIALKTKPAYCRHISVLEDKIGQALPFEPLRKLILDISLRDSEEKELSNWIQAAVAKKISAKLLHRALQALREHVANLHKTEADTNVLDLPVIEDALFWSGAENIFLQEDEKYIEWRNRLLYGSKILFGDKVLTLGQSIEPKQNYKEDRNLVFNIQEDPDHVLIIGCNEAILGLKEQVWASEYFYGGIIRKCADVKNGYALVEKLYAPLSSHKWITQPGDEVDDGDKDFLLPVVNMLAWLACEDNPTPNNLSAKYFHFDREGVLKMTKVLTSSQKRDFTALENFANECALGNRSIFRYLMEESGLKKDPAARFYKSMVKSALENKPANALGVAFVHTIEDDQVKARGEALHREITQMAANLQDRLKNLWWRTPPEWQKKKISDCIYHYYKNTGSAGILWKTMEEEIFIQLSPKKPDQADMAKEKTAPHTIPFAPDKKIPMSSPFAKIFNKVPMLQPNKAETPRLSLKISAGLPK